MGICYRYFLSKEDAKDIANMSIYKILTNIQSYDETYAFTTWISKITTNTIFEEFRKKRKLQNIQYTDEYTENYNTSTINDYLEKLNYNEILKIIEQLDKTEKIIFNMFFIDGYSHKEIAQSLNISEGTSKWYLNQAKNKLKKVLSHQIIVHEEK